MKLDMKTMQMFRRITQILAIIFFGEFYSKTLNATRSLVYMFIERNFEVSKILITAFLVAFLAILTIFFGRVFCGWFCLFGGLNDLLNFLSEKIIKKKITVKRELDSKLKYIKYAILIAMIVLVWFYGEETGGALKTPIGRLVILIVIAGMIFINRFFCRYVCPLGAIQAIFSKIKLSWINKPTENCGNCKLCNVSCPMGVNLDKIEEVRDTECIVCMKCVDVCRSKNPGIVLWGKKINAYMFLWGAILVYVIVNIVDKVISTK